MAQVPVIRQNQAGNAYIDGANPSYLPRSFNRPAKICHIDGASLFILGRKNAPKIGRKSGKGLMRTKNCFETRLPTPTPSAC